MNKKIITRGSILITALYITLITTLSLVKFSTDMQPPKIEHLDKVVHFCFYFILNILLLFTSLRLKGKMSSKYIIVSTLLTIGYSAVLEFLQPLTGRNNDLLDMCANSSGAIIGALTFITFKSKLNFLK